MSAIRRDSGPNPMFEKPLNAVVGGRTAKQLEKAFEMSTVGDLLWHFPRRYSNRGDLTPLTGLPVGEHVTVLAQVLDVVERTMQRRRGSILQVRITDGQGTLSLTFFNQGWRARELVAGTRGIFSGKVSLYSGQLQLQHPDYELFDTTMAEFYQATGMGGMTPEKDAELSEAAARAFAERPVPIYPATAQVPTWTLAKAVEVALAEVRSVVDPLPASITKSEGILELADALEKIHRPERAADWKQAQQSMRFREAFELQLALLDRRRRAGRAESTPRAAIVGGLLDRFDAELPFELTGDQQQVGHTLATELAQPHPMHRLLQGEVGSGKTLVAMRAMLQVAEHGGQSAMLAPTEVLAAQHFHSVVEMLGPELAAELDPVLLTGRMPVAERRRALLAIASGAARIVVGTHALLGDQVSFYDLGFIVVDEQHRFGVDQRETLRQKGTQPHVLTMTATPIPRTVALTAFGDLEVSTIRELPPGRQGIDTFVVPVLEMPNRAARVWARAAEDIAAGRQIYIVCPAISPGTVEEGEDAEPDEREDEARQAPLASVESTLAELRAQPQFAQHGVEGLTSAMKSDEKNRVMRAFASGEVSTLVATTVIEVGVNVPNATIMIVRDADRFGISQLHQLRGRVGRGDHAGLCLLLTSAEQGTVARERIEAIAATPDGFELAEVDLALRREGDILGTAQSGGRSTLKLLRVAEHGELIVHAREVAGALLDRDPELHDAPGLQWMLAEEAAKAHLDGLAKS